jgi:type I site-specific restriction endonuclease
MGLSEADTRAKLIDPALHARGWSKDLIRWEETAETSRLLRASPAISLKERSAIPNA